MRRILLVLTLLVALLALPATAFAQDATPPVVCGDLPEEDCALLEASREAMQGLSTYDASVNFDLALSDVPNLPSDISVGLVSDGAFSFNPELAARMMDMQANPPGDPAEAVAEVMDVALSFYQDTAFDMTWDITLSSDVAQLLSAQAGLALPESLNLPMRLVDGFFYANVDDLAQIVPGLAGWLGFDIAGLMEASLEQSMAALEEGMATMDPSMMGMMGASNGLPPELQDAVENNVTVERLDDATVGDVDVAQFQFTFDMAGFLTEPAVLDMVMQQVQAQMELQAAMGAPSEGMPSAADIQMVADMVPMLAPMLLSGLTFETNTQVGIEDAYVYSTETNVAWDMGSLVSMAGAMMQGGAAPQTGAAPYFELNVLAENSNFDGDVEIVAPEDATIIPLDQMMQEQAPVM